MDAIKEHLIVLEFDVSVIGFALPKLNVVSKRFRDLARVKHSDKGGDDAEFIKLYNAYSHIKDFYLNLETGEMQTFCSNMEEEEELMKNLFEDFNISRKNKSSFTIFIKNYLSFIWDKVLEKRYGKPDDKDVNGLHWTHLSYAFKDLEKSNIFLRKYHMPRSAPVPL